MGRREARAPVRPQRHQPRRSVLLLSAHPYPPPPPAQSKRHRTRAAASTYLLPRLVGHAHATALLLTGGTFTPRSPHLQGLYHAVLARRAQVLPAALAFAQELAANTSQPAVACTKALLWRGADSIEAQHVLDSRALRELAAGRDAAEGALAFKERRPARFVDALSQSLSAWMPWVRPRGRGAAWEMLTSALRSGEKWTSGTAWRSCDGRVPSLLSLVSMKCKCHYAGGLSARPGRCDWCTFAFPNPSLKSWGEEKSITRREDPTLRATLSPLRDSHRT